MENVLPVYNKEVILGIKHFIVEDVRSARRFLKKVDRGIDIDALTFYPLNKHTSPEDISGYLKPLLAGQSMGVISEAGCPAVADPGADVVAIAQRKNLKVVPLVGPSSIIMSVMGSGFNGQDGVKIDYETGDSEADSSVQVTIENSKASQKYHTNQNSSNNSKNNSSNKNTTAAKTNTKTTASQKIRGNSRSKVYHCPGQRDYDRMGTSKYLVTFKSEKEAKVAGYHKAQR